MSSIRTLATVLLAFLVTFAAIPQARAADTANMSSEGAAYLACEANRSATQAVVQQYTYGCQRDGPGHFYKCVTTNPGVNGICTKGVGGAYMYTWPAGTECPNGAGNTSSGCAPSQAECLAKPPLGPTFTGGSTVANACVNGCMYSAATTGGACVTTSSGSACAVTGATPTGAGCTAGPTPITDKPQQCTPNGEVCIKPDGQHCMAASNGRQVCWRPGETGEKDDNNVKQKRDAGTTPVAPNLQLPSGDTLSPVGPPKVTTTVTNNTTITTVTQNYQTANGTNAGTKNAGESGTGDGTGKDGDGDGSASGGENCQAPPITAGDPVMGMVATQAWQTRCAVDAGNNVKVTGDIANCATPYTVEGTNANANILRAMRAQACPNTANGPDPNQYLGEDEAPPGIVEHNVDFEPDDSGYGWGRTCPVAPAVEVFGQSINIDTGPLCDWLNLGGWFVMLLAGLKCLRMLTEA